MQAMERMDSKWNTGLNRKVKSEEKVSKSGSETSTKDSGRAQVVGSGWKQTGKESKLVRCKVQVKMDVTLRAMQDSRKPLKVQLRNQKPNCLGDTGIVEAETKSETNPLVACLPLRGKKACSQKWQDVILGWTPVAQENMEKCCVLLSGKKACSQRWQNMVLHGTPAIQDKTGTRTESSSPTLSVLENDNLEAEVQIENAKEGDVQDEHLPPSVRLDDCNQASGDYACRFHFDLEDTF
ncbi:uncharacterized protein LOC134077602 [Sardina pilchardus]|uniref:uncharacterized protein LOC134077602 n=1 Tax=Sardina pilchardus TaxID=27697 RepID=UPI002E1507F4